MRISIEKLTAEAQKTGFRAEILEKVARLTSLLNSLGGHPFLRKKIVLKGGTALNLWILIH
jgi:predicted nucleotidyltransferase component of viral defense system